MVGVPAYLLRGQMIAPWLGPLTALSLRIGNLTFGGGDPAMAALQRELVERRQWLTQEDFTLIWSLSRVTPGTNVVACFAGANTAEECCPSLLVNTEIVPADPHELPTVEMRLPLPCQMACRPENVNPPA